MAFSQRSNFLPLVISLVTLHSTLMAQLGRSRIQTTLLRLNCIQNKNKMQKNNSFYGGCSLILEPVWDVNNNNNNSNTNSSSLLECLWKAKSPWKANTNKHLDYNKNKRKQNNSLSSLPPLSPLLILFHLCSPVPPLHFASVLPCTELSAS